MIAHPECEPHILAYADHIGSTSSLLQLHEGLGASRRFIVATEAGILHQMQKHNPAAELHPVAGHGRLVQRATSARSCA